MRRIIFSLMLASAILTVPPNVTQASQRFVAEFEMVLNSLLNEFFPGRGLNANNIPPEIRRLIHDGLEKGTHRGVGVDSHLSRDELTRQIRAMLERGTPINENLRGFNPEPQFVRPEDFNPGDETFGKKNDGNRMRGRHRRGGFIRLDGLPVLFVGVLGGVAVGMPVHWAVEHVTRPYLGNDGATVAGATAGYGAGIYGAAGATRLILPNAIPGGFRGHLRVTARGGLWFAPVAVLGVGSEIAHRYSGPLHAYCEELRRRGVVMTPSQREDCETARLAESYTLNLGPLGRYSGGTLAVGAGNYSSYWGEPGWRSWTPYGWTVGNFPWSRRRGGNVQNASDPPFTGETVLSASACACNETERSRSSPWIALIAVCGVVIFRRRRGA